MDSPTTDKSKGEVRVGRIIDRKNPSCGDFTLIIVMMKSHSKWWPLSPYYLKTKEGYIHENIWQFSKIYPVVPKSDQKYSRFDSTIIWSWPEEAHMENNEILPAYWKWRTAGFQNEYAVRYPVGFRNRHSVKCHIKDEERLDYVTARKKIYLPLYLELVKQQPLFEELKERLLKGENLLIAEVDGPHEESLKYYIEKYKVGTDFIESNTMLATPANLDIMLNDTKHAFGHGYCLAMALLDL